MKTKIVSGFTALLFCIAISARAQTVQYVTLTPGINLQLQTNQIVSVVGFSFSYGNGEIEQIEGQLPNGISINLNPYGGVNGSAIQTVSAQIPQIVTGMTNIYVSAGWATFKIETPCTASVISNYIPADAIVIPASATGNVQIILESSPDLVNWTAANPGTYGASAGTNRFFRVRAAVSP